MWVRCDDAAEQRRVDHRWRAASAELRVFARLPRSSPAPASAASTRRSTRRSTSSSRRACAASIDLAINGSYWVGIAMGAGLTLVVLNPRDPADRDRLAARVRARRGARPRDPGRAPARAREPALAAAPRLLARRRTTTVRRRSSARSAPPAHAPRPSAIHVTGCGRAPRPDPHADPCAIRAARSSALVLMFSQAFLYNAIFFTYALVLARVSRRRARRTSASTSCPSRSATSSGRSSSAALFDRLGRRVMIPVTYALVGRPARDHRRAVRRRPARPRSRRRSRGRSVFFVASAAASSAYLTVSELFPVELRGRAIAVFYAFGTLVGAGAPVAVRRARSTPATRGSCSPATVGAPALMIGAAIVARMLGVDAEALARGAARGLAIEAPR